MATVSPSRIVSAAASAPMTTTFLTAIRASGVTRTAPGYVMDALGSTRGCYVNAAGNWDLTASLSMAVPIDATTFADLRASPAGYSRELTLVTFANGTRGGICVAVDPSGGGPPDPG